MGRPRRPDQGEWINVWCITMAVIGLAAVAFLTPTVPTIVVYMPAGVDAVADKQKQVLEQQASTDKVRFRTIILNTEEQRQFVKANGCGVDRFDELISRDQEHLARELWKFCALATQTKHSDAVYIDRSSPLVVRLQDIADHSSSIAVLANEYFPASIHGSLLVLRKKHHPFAAKMLALLQTSLVEVLEASPLLIPKTLYRLIADSRGALVLQAGKNAGSWYLLEQHCEMNPLRRIDGVAYRSKNDNYLVHMCPANNEFCCVVRDDQQVVLMNRHPLLPFQKITDSSHRPLNTVAGFYHEDELPYISTVREKTFARPKDFPDTPNLYDIFEQQDMLPSSKCLHCMHMRLCEHVEHYCSDYMTDLCEAKLPEKFVSKQITVMPPLYQRDPSRLIPRIVHQTWYEPLTEADYPNMSRLVESFRQSGWEYKFYSDDEAAAFLATHFPPEVLWAYQALIPGAFKADLFRYCALLIHGGVYADVDILLEATLDAIVEPDIGFMVPHDEPDAMVWQGFIAAAPGHPFLAKAIESVVNGVRNRFTSIDIDATFCPTPNYKVLHMFDVLFTAGPGLLGASINRVLGRHGQTLLPPGDLIPENDEGADFVKVPLDHHGKKLPGRSVILKQNKEDMGAHRFTWVERNLIVASTDLKDSDDRQNKKVEKETEDKEGGGGGGEHYSKAHAKTGIYGLQGLYKDQDRANEDIRIIVDATRGSLMSSSIEKVDSQ